MLFTKLWKKYDTIEEPWRFLIFFIPLIIGFVIPKDNYFGILFVVALVILSFDRAIYVIGGKK